MRKTLAIIVVLLFVLPMSAFAALSDVAVTHKNHTAINFLYDRGVISGYPDGTFQPSRTINRAELTKILVGGAGVETTAAEYNNCFPDVTDQWFAEYVCYAKAQGWIAGYPDNTFKPDKTVNKVEAIKMLVNSQGFAVPENAGSSVNVFGDIAIDQWYAPFMSVALEKGLIETDGITYGIGDGMTRGEVSENIYRAIIVNEEGLTSFDNYVQGDLSGLEGPYVVSKVVDGDTIDVEINGEDVRLRLIGLDTPETVHPDKPVQCFGQEASNRVKADLLYNQVYLEADSTQSDKDVYGRLLRYVILPNGVNYNKKLIQGGYGFEYTYDSNPYIYHDEFVAAEAAAREAGLGLWDTDGCNGEASAVGSNSTTSNTTGGDYKFYVSSEARTKYYCETDPLWENLSKNNLLEFDTEQELLDWMQSVNKNLELNQPC